MAGAGKGKGRGPIIASSAVLGGLCLLGLILFAIAATVIISIISLYPPNQSKESKYDYFRIQGLGLKVLFANDLNRYYGGAVTSSAVLYALCTSAYTRNITSRNFAGCAIINANAYSASNASATSRRRRRAPSGAIEIGEASIVYSTSCGAPGDSGKYASAANLNSCTRKRLSECNALSNSAGFNSWGPVPSGSTQTIFSSTTNTNVQEVLTDVLTMPLATLQSYAAFLGIGQAVRDRLNLGCQYVGQITSTQAATLLLAGINGTQGASATTIMSG